MLSALLKTNVHTYYMYVNRIINKFEDGLKYDWKQLLEVFLPGQLTVHHISDLFNWWYLLP